MSMNEAQAARAFPKEYAKFPPAKVYPPEFVGRLVGGFVELGYLPEKIIGGLSIDSRLGS